MSYPRLLLPCLGVAVSMALTSCKTLSTSSAESGGGKPSKEVNIPFLLSMDFAEACALSGKHAELSPALRVAADEVEVLRTDAKGRPRKVRARGHVFVEMDDASQARALCQEALITDEDLILRGNPLLARGQSTVEGLSDLTVFYVMGARLRAIGPHKVSNVGAESLGAPVLAAWKSGPNPLLPPLDANAVPDSVREEVRKAAEAEALLQKSRLGMPPAFPNSPLEKPVPIPEPSESKVPEKPKPKDEPAPAKPKA